MSSASVQLRVNGREYGGWKSARITRGIESLCGGFELAVSDRWNSQSKAWPIREEDECAVLIGDWPVVVGYVDSRSVSYSAEDHSVSVSGRDKTSALVDCSADLGAWEFKNISLGKLAERLCEPYGISVLTQSGLSFSPVSRVSIDPGETAFEVLKRACAMAGALPISDQGDLLLTRAGSTRAVTALVEGKNILSASATRGGAERFATYRVLGQQSGSDGLFGSHAAATKGEAADSSVRRTERKLVLRADGNASVAQAKARAQWEAIVRAGRAQTATVTVQGWTQGDGSLWPVNALVHVSSPLLEIDSDMLIAEVVSSLNDSSGTTTTLSLRRPDAYLPEPTVKPKGKAGTSPWAEIAGGA